MHASTATRRSVRHGWLPTMHTAHGSQARGAESADLVLKWSGAGRLVRNRPDRRDMCPARSRSSPAGVSAAQAEDPTDDEESTPQRPVSLRKWAKVQEVLRRPWGEGWGARSPAHAG